MAEKEKKSSRNSVGQSYGAEQITVLEGLDPVRKRPGMYIGTTGPDGLHHLITEIFDNSRDEAMGGFANNIEIALLPENRVRVVDNGRGIPVDIHKQTKVSALETIMTTLHAGGKFGGEGYKVSGGLHGVGASVVNALSIYCRAEIHRDGSVHAQEYSQGKKKSPVKKIGSTKQNGTIITFQPDPAIFPDTNFNFERVVTHMRQQSYLVRGLRISVIDARGLGRVDDSDVFYLRELHLNAPSMTFYFDGGLVSLVKFENAHASPIHRNIFYVEKSGNGNEYETVEVALQYVDDISSRILPFANNIYTAEGGTHITGFKTTLTRTLNNYARKNNLVSEKEDNFTGDDVLEGLTAVVSIKLQEIQFEGQTKGKLGSVEAQAMVTEVFGEAFSTFLEENPDDAKAMVQKATLALKARKAAKAAKDSVLRKGALEGMTLPGKLADCQSGTSAEDAELFIVEGDSAGGCFSADTEVALADGRNLSFGELVNEDQMGKTNYCYTITDDGRIGIQKVTNPRKTKAEAEVIKVILDTDEKITCTPDHLFMLRNGTYKEARDLTKEDSLMPLRKKISKIGGKITIKGYEMVYDPKIDHWIFTHLLSDEYNLRNQIYSLTDGDQRHHKDFNKRNNNPENIVRLTKEEHMALHASLYEKNLQTPEVLEKLRAIRQTPAYREKIRAKMLSMRDELSARAKVQWENEEYKKYMVRKFLDFYASNPEYRESNNKLLNNLQKKYWSEEGNRKKQSVRVKSFFENNQALKQIWSDTARRQWENSDLLEWRSSETKKQWTEEFRAKRKKAYNNTYYENTIKVLKRVYEQHHEINVEAFENIRRAKRDNNILSFSLFINRFFAGDSRNLEEAVKNYNHKIKKIVKLQKRVDVYDIEVPGTHNFALSSGVFVHNSAKMGRDRRMQAILALRGKILNIERARLDRMLASEQIKNIVIALGTAIGDTFDISKLRYHKVIIASDADVDGAHIRTLFLTLMYRYFRPLIDAGYIYIAQPPLYKIKIGKELFYAYSDEEKAGVLKGKDNADIQRYKGLGEMNSDELWETTMDPTKRILKQVTIDDAREADRIFDILMGTDVPSRKSFIQSNAKKATLDI